MNKGEGWEDSLLALHIVTFIRKKSIQGLNMEEYDLI